MLSKILQTIAAIWNRPIYYGGKPQFVVNGRCRCCGAFVDRAEYVRAVQTDLAAYSRFDDVDRMSAPELLAYRQAALAQIVSERGVW